MSLFVIRWCGSMYRYGVWIVCCAEHINILFYNNWPLRSFTNLKSNIGSHFEVISINRCLQVNPLMDAMNYSPRNIRSPLEIKLALMYYSVYYKQRAFYLQMFGGRIVWKFSNFWCFVFKNCGVNYTNFLVLYLLPLFISAMSAPFSWRTTRFGSRMT